MVQRTQDCYIISCNTAQIPKRKRYTRADIHVISGSVEIAPGIGLADAIFDIVSSGSTLVSNNLEEVHSVVESQAVLIKGAGVTLSDDKAAILDELLFRFEAVKAAEGRKYILMNVPRQKLDEVLAILPGMKSPTVLPLANADWCSVHSVLDEKMFLADCKPTESGWSRGNTCARHRENDTLRYGNTALSRPARMVPAHRKGHGITGVAGSCDCPFHYGRCGFAWR